MRKLRCRKIICPRHIANKWHSGDYKRRQSETKTLLVTSIVRSFYMMQLKCRGENIFKSSSSCKDSEGRLVVGEGSTEEVRKYHVLWEKGLIKGAGSVNVL